MKLKLWQKLFLPTILGLLLVIGTLVTVGTTAQEQSIIDAENDQLNDSYAAFNEHIHEETRTVLAIATVLADRSEVQQAAAAQDREALLAALTPIYQQLEAEYHIKHLYIHRADGITLLRVHKPEDWGDDSASFRHMIVDLNASQEPVSGIELGRSGIAVRGAVPLYYQGEFIGSVEVGIDLDKSTLTEMVENQGGQWRIFLTQEAATTITNRELTSLDAGPVENVLTYANTTGYFAPVDALTYAQVLDSTQHVIERVEADGSYFAVMSAPLYDYRGNVLGVVQIEYPRNTTIAMIAATQRQAIGLGLGATVLVILVLGLVVRASLKPLGVLNQTTERIAAGDLNVEVEVSAGDEIGELARRFQLMVGKLRESFASLNQRMDELAIARQQAQEANRLKSEFLATMSHELRTPLNAMIGFTEIMLSGMGGALDGDAQHMTERIHANSQRLLNLINNVLDLSKIEAKRVEIIARPFSPRKLAENLYQHTQSLASQRRLEFEYHLDPNLPQRLMGDEGIIERVALNLLSNAFKFTERGRVSFTLARNGHNGMWEMSVTDTGIGIPPHALEYIFDPFRQVDGSSQRAYGGSGLGLAIVRELVRSMDGSIHVDSTLGKGSTFTVLLPLVEVEEQELVREFA